MGRMVIIEANPSPFASRRCSWAEEFIVLVWYVPGCVTHVALSEPIDNLGNIFDLFHRHAWTFHAQCIERYGGVFKFYGPLGVSC